MTLISTVNAQKPPTQKWFKICAKQAESDVCNVQYKVVASTGQVITSVNLFTVTGKINRRIFQVTVPTFRLIPAGVAIKIDAKKENRIPYMHCFREICTAEIKMDDNLVKLLKSGSQMVLTSTNFQNKLNPIKVSLEGFTAAFDGPSIKRSELEKDNEALQKQLEKRAKKARDELEKQQNKAIE
ncbi:MAG: invasion associated locus B family protein [Hyphomicrobiales bacterium]|nr:invasion associated locus B family protein [Hyphomicrobiales bacterium]